MGLIVNGVTIENIKVINSVTQNETELDVLQNQHKVVVWNKDTEFISESEGSIGFVYEGIDVNGYLESSESFDGTIVAYALTDIDNNTFDYNTKSIIVPSVHNGLEVRKIIGGCVFLQSLPNLEEIKLGYNIKTINATGKNYVYDEENGYTNTSYAAFYFRENLVKSISIFIPSSVEEIRGYYFMQAYPPTDINIDIICVLNGNAKLYTYGDGSNQRLIHAPYTNVNYTFIFGEKVTETYVFASYYTQTGTRQWYGALDGANKVIFNCKNPIEISQNNFLAGRSVEIEFNNKVSKITGADMFYDTGKTSLSLPSSLIELSGQNFCSGASSLTSIVFEHAPTDIINIAENKNIFYVKSATACNVYTNNQKVVDYNWGHVNRTPTFYYLDETTKWEQLATPTAAIDGNILTITGVDNAAYYKVINGGEVILQTTDLSVDLSQYITTAGSYNITVRAFKDGFAGSQPSVAVTYTIS